MNIKALLVCVAVECVEMVSGGRPENDSGRILLRD
jgi:hypothetical protein